MAIVRKPGRRSKRDPAGVFLQHPPVFFLRACQSGRLPVPFNDCGRSIAAPPCLACI
jgi:hypothetical protein